MPRFQPVASPTFSCSTTMAAGSTRRAASTVPSVDALSTTTTSSPRTLSRQRWIHRSALWVTTTTPTSGMARVRAAASQALPEQDHPARERHHDRDDEEEEPGRERRVRVHAQLAEEADEEGLADGETVERERDDQDEEEERAHHVIDERAEVDPDRFRRRPDREHPDRLQREREREDSRQQPAVRAEGVDAFVEGP